ncbi:hypothetical protein [Filimonas effusa]|uniref:PKD domain-containing protein n=1 Tax=Filimonas effusa TaxID=2508721 RepID=A0A4Q1D793_9BACT|nr:hypothetical protein [Filimonas effusa]RXK83557.1 hypothetical protein ESB13_15825 [Filimonas effusa]
MKPLLVKLMKKGIAVFAVIFALQSQAQTISTPADLSKNSNDPTQGTSTSNGSTLFCAENTGFTLVSSTTDGTTAYTGYSWEEKQADGSFGAVANRTPDASQPEKLIISAATPGWHTYQVTAAVSAAACPADPVIFTVFVLPKLKLTSSANKSDANSLTYCAQNGAPTGSSNEIVFSATPSYDGTPNAFPTLPAPAVTDFALTYKWYKVEGTTRTLISGASGSSYTLVDPADASATTRKEYTFEVEVAYNVKTCATYGTTATQSGNTTTAVVVVVPKPNKPTITIQ